MLSISIYSSVFVRTIWIICIYLMYVMNVMNEQMNKRVDFMDRLTIFMDGWNICFFFFFGVCVCVCVCVYFFFILFWTITYFQHFDIEYGGFFVFVCVCVCVCFCFCFCFCFVLFCFEPIRIFSTLTLNTGALVGREGVKEILGAQLEQKMAKDVYGHISFLSSPQPHVGK